jgi:hypothetical protein
VPSRSLLGNNFSKPIMKSAYLFENIVDGIRGRFEKNIIITLSL